MTEDGGRGVGAPSHHLEEEGEGHPDPELEGQAAEGEGAVFSVLPTRATGVSQPQLMVRAR